MFSCYPEGEVCACLEKLFYVNFFWKIKRWNQVLRLFELYFSSAAGHSLWWSYSFRYRSVINYIKFQRIRSFSEICIFLTQKTFKEIFEWTLRLVFTFVIIRLCRFAFTLLIYWLFIIFDYKIKLFFLSLTLWNFLNFCITFIR